MSETTPFLDRTGGDDDYDHGDHVVKISPANSHFKTPLWILDIINSALSLAVFGLLIAAFVLISTGPFQYTYSSKESVRDLAICLFVNVLVSAPAIFFQIPILLNMSVHIAMSIVLFVFSGKLFADGWPDSGFCRRYDRNPEPPYIWKPLPETVECKNARTVLRIILGIGTGMAIVVGLLMLAMLLLRVVAVFRTKFWQSKTFKGLRNFEWNPRGFTIQFSLSVIRQEPAGGNQQSGKGKGPALSGSGEGRLIDT